jgi:outer membrane receptor protein involved in Fe transport
LKKLNLLAIGIKTALLAGGISGVGFAVAAEDTSAEKVERIEVTGSKIKRLSADAPTPVIVIGRVELENAGVSNVNDFLAELPSAEVGLSPENSNNTIYANGLNTTDLRGLGSSRTLVLVNGRRFIGGMAGDNAVDLNNISTSFIDRIEISTGGASAVYGADAVAGVVNIITRKSFDGVEFDLSTTRPTEGAGDQTFGSLTFGKEYADGGFIFNYDYAEQKQMARSDKSWYMDKPLRTIANPDDTSGTDGIPGRVIVNKPAHYGLYDESSEFFLGGKQWTFDESGNLRPFNTGDGYLPKGGLPGSPTNYYYTGAFGDGIEYAADEFFRTPLTRHTINFAGNQKLAEDHDLSFDFTYAKNEAFGQSTPIFFRSIQIKRDNAFIKDDLAKLMDDAGAKSISMRRLSDDFGPRVYNQQRNTVRASIGIDGLITDNWTYSAYLQHGELKQDTSWFGEILMENVENGFDAVNFKGNIVCAERNDKGEVVGGKAGCVPLNVLGKYPLTQEQLDYHSTVATAEQGHKQSSYGITVTGDVFDLPAGAVQTAFSYDWRKERAYEAPGTGIRKGLIFGNSGLPYEGELTVKEYATEVLVPILADQYLAQEVNFEFAYRYMDYSSTGTDSAYKLGLTWQVNDDVRLRFAKAQSVRAPNVNELYSSTGTQFATRAESCAADSIAKEDQYKEQVTRNCAADGIPAGWVPSDAWRSGGSLEGKLGGNSELQNEVSNDITFGVIYTPSYLENFEITADYWSFEIKDAISFYDYESAMENCYRSDSLDNPFCGKFTRDPVTHEVTDYLETSLNAAVEKLSGLDIESVYKYDTSFGQFGFKLVATYLDNRERNPTGNAEDNRIHTGEETRPRWRARFNTSYTYDDFRLVLVANYRHSTVMDRNDWTIEDHDYNEIPSYTTFDLSGTYNVHEKVSLRLGVQNLTDNTTPYHPATFVDGAYYDVIGRRVTAGVNVKF